MLLDTSAMGKQDVFSEFTKYELFGTFCLSMVAEVIANARELMSKVKKRAR